MLRPREGWCLGPGRVEVEAPGGLILKPPGGSIIRPRTKYTPIWGRRILYFFVDLQVFPG